MQVAAATDGGQEAAQGGRTFGLAGRSGSGSGAAEVGRRSGGPGMLRTRRVASRGVSVRGIRPKASAKPSQREDPGTWRTPLAEGGDRPCPGCTRGRERQRTKVWGDRTRQPSSPSSGGGGRWGGQRRPNWRRRQPNWRRTHPRRKGGQDRPTASAAPVAWGSPPCGKAGTRRRGRRDPTAPTTSSQEGAGGVAGDGRAPYQCGAEGANPTGAGRTHAPEDKSLGGQNPTALSPTIGGGGGRWGGQRRPNWRRTHPRRKGGRATWGSLPRTMKGAWRR